MSFHGNTGVLAEVSEAQDLGFRYQICAGYLAGRQTDPTWQSLHSAHTVGSRYFRGFNDLTSSIHYILCTFLRVYPPCPPNVRERRSPASPQGDSC